ncbi:MAPEG family protein [Marivivens marinus]|uniref:MAPEG family protein n=1 Tax=Marivivens marinus TaxID=3110173 RepID=UPI003B84972A
MIEHLALPVTLTAAVINGALFQLLTWRVVRGRRRHKIVLGDGDDRAMAKAIRGQANAAEQMPIALILLGLAEMNGAAPGLLWGLAGLFTLGRMSHGAYFAIHGLHWRLRFWGMLATLLAQAGLILTGAALLIF